MVPAVTVVNGQFTLTDTSTGQSIAGFDTVDVQIVDGRPLMQFGVYQFNTATFTAPGDSPVAATPTPTPAPSSPTPSPTPTGT